MSLTFSTKVHAETPMGRVTDVIVTNSQAPDVSIHIVFLRSYMCRIQFGAKNACLDFFVDINDELSKYAKLSEYGPGPQRNGDISIDLPEQPPFECTEYPQLCSAYRSFRTELNTTWAEDNPEYAGLINSLKTLFTGVKV